MDDEARLGREDRPDTAGQRPSGPAAAEVRFRRDLQLEQDDLVIFGEDGKFHLVQKATYMAHELPTSLMSAAEFVVGLGTMVSDVTAFYWDTLWRKLVGRCSCIVLNLAAIRQISEKEGKPITFLQKPDGKERQAGRKSDDLADEEASPAGPSTGRKPKPSTKLGRDDLVIFNEDRKFYWVKCEDYMSSTLPPEMRSAPELLVKLGVVVADIPRLPTAGTACFLLNLASVRRGSSYAAQILEENIQIARLPEGKGKAAREALEAEREEADNHLHWKRGKDALQLKAWTRSAREFEKAQHKPPAYVLQKMIAQQLQVFQSRLKSLHKLEALHKQDKSLHAEVAPAVEPGKGVRELRTVSVRSKRAPGGRAPKARHTPRGGKK